MSVLNKLTKKEKKTLNRCFKDRAVYFYWVPLIDDIKSVSFKFNSLCGEFRNFKRILAALYYSLSREKRKNTEEFDVVITCLYDFMSFNKDDEKVNNDMKNMDNFVAFKKVTESNKIFSFSTLNFLQELSKYFDPFSNLELIFSFIGGNFSEDELQKINEEKIFKSEKCVICMEVEPNFCFHDCGHLCVCDKCFFNIKNLRRFNTKCPLCKKTNSNFKEL